jgi:hypothetical protein
MGIDVYTQLAWPDSAALKPKSSLLADSFF